MGSKRAGEALLRALPVALLIALVPSAALAGDPKEQWAAGLNGRIVDVDITSSGRTIIASSDGLITFTDDKGNKLKQPGFLSPAVRITSDGLKVAAGRASSMALIDNAGTTLWEKSLGGKVTGVGMDSSAQLIAAGADDKYVHLFDGTGTALGRAFVGEIPSGVAVAGDRVATGLPSGKVLLLDKGAQSLLEANAGAPVNAVDISSSTIAVATETVVVVLSYGGEVQWKATLGSPVKAVATTPDGSLVAAAGQAGDVSIFNNKGEFLYRFKTTGEALTGVGLSPDGQWVAIGSREANVKLYKLNFTAAQLGTAAPASPSASPAPAATPSPATPVPTAATASPPPTPAAATPTPTAAATLTPVPSPTPTPKKSPGFEALAALAALGVAVTLRKRRT